LSQELWIAWEEA